MLLALNLVLADGIRIDIGTFHLSVTLGFLIYLLIAAIIGFLAEFIVGWRIPFGFIGAIIAALIGIWLMTNVIQISGIGDIYVGTDPRIPLIRALIGAI